jgi:hypothetical protein
LTSNSLSYPNIVSLLPLDIRWLIVLQHKLNQAKTFEEERALGIQEQVTTSWRKQNDIPDSDGFETYLQGPQQVDKRNRSETVSTANSDKHDGKRQKLGYIQE